MVRSVPWATTTTGRPATAPTNETTPATGATTASPGAPTRSTPRWPAPQRTSGGSYPRTTAPASGHTPDAPAAGWPQAATHTASHTTIDTLRMPQYLGGACHRADWRGGPRAA